MKIVEVIAGKVTHEPISFWRSLQDIPKGVPEIYFEAPDEVQEGWLYTDGKFFEPTPELVPRPPQLIVADQLQQLEQDNLTLMVSLAAIYEMMIAGGVAE